MPQLKTLFLSAISQITHSHKNLSLSKSHFILKYKNDHDIDLHELFEVYAGKEKSQRDAFLEQYFEALLRILEESHFNEEWNDEFKEKQLCRIRHLSALGNDDTKSPFVQREVLFADKTNEKRVDLGMRLVCEMPSHETKQGNVLIKNEWLEKLNVTKDTLLGTALENLNRKFKMSSSSEFQAHWKLCEMGFQEDPDREKEYFYLSDFRDVYLTTRVLLYPDQVLPKDVVQETRSGESSWVLVILGDDLVALARAKHRWALLQVSQTLVERLEAPTQQASRVIQCKALRLISENNLLQWMAYSPNYKEDEGFPPRSTLEFEAVKNGLVQELQKQNKNSS